MYSQHSEGPQPVEGVDGDAAQPVVAQDPAEKSTVFGSPYLSCPGVGAVHTAPGQRQGLSSPFEQMDKRILTTEGREAPPQHPGKLTVPSFPPAGWLLHQLSHPLPPLSI